MMLQHSDDDTLKTIIHNNDGGDNDDDHDHIDTPWGCWLPVHCRLPSP